MSIEAARKLKTAGANTPFNEQVFHKTKLLLKIYRNVVWNLEESVADMNERCTEKALAYELDSERLSDIFGGFDNCIELDQYALEGRLRSACKTKWLLDLINKSLLRLRNYPDYGEDYFHIIYHQYISKERYTEARILGLLHMEHTTFYKRKKEAINLLGIILWGYEQPSLRELWGRYRAN